MEIEKQTKPIYLLSGFWCMLMVFQGIIWVMGWGFKQHWSDVYLILFIILRRIEYECDYKKPWIQWLSQN